MEPTRTASFVASSLSCDPGLAEMIAASDSDRPHGLMDLSIGDPDLPCDPRVIEAAFQDARAGHTHYADPYGDGELRAAIRLAWQQDHDVEVGPDELMITASATHAMSLLLDAVLDPGDECVVFSPFFTPYEAQVAHAGGTCVEAPCSPENGFVPTAGILRRALTDRTKAVILNNPNNPTGACMTMAQLQEIVNVCRERHILLVADEIYTSFSFFSPFCPVRWCVGSEEVCAVVRSFSKDYSMSGWRIGYAVAPADVVRAMRAINESNVYVAPTPSQRAGLAAIGLRHEIRGRIHEVYGDRMRFALRRARDLPGVSAPSSKGTLYLFLDVRGTGMDDRAFVSLMEREARVRLLSGSGFGSAGAGFCRMALREDIPALGRAFDAMARALAAGGDVVPFPTGEVPPAGEDAAEA